MSSKAMSLKAKMHQKESDGDMREEYNIDGLNPRKNPYADRFEKNMKNGIAEEIKQGLLEAIEYEKGNLEANSRTISISEENHRSV